MSSANIDVIRMIAEASHMVQFVMLTLLTFSVISWSIIFMKWLYMRRAFRQSAYFLEVFWESRDLSVAYKEAGELDGSPVARVFSLGYEELKKLNHVEKGKNGEPRSAMSERFSGIDNVKRTLRRAITTEITRMSQSVPFLATAGNTTPFIGLFGTVWGIMESFHGIGLTGSASLAVVAPGISEALVATAAGLAVAIPAVIAFNFFNQRVRLMDNELQSFAADFLNIIESDILPASGK